ncbi:hypothetical protein Tco_0425660 [Tanacetum coccineum]
MIMDLNLSIKLSELEPLRVSHRPTPDTRPCSMSLPMMDFQENSDDEADERSSEEYLRNIELEFHERALLANLKCFIKRKNKFLSQKANEDTECYKCEKEVSDDEEITHVKVLMDLADDELVVGKNHAHNSEWIDITMRKRRDDLLVFKQAKLDAITFQIQNTELTKLNYALQEQLKEERKGASPSSEVMSLTYQDHSPIERLGLGTMKHTKPKTQESSSKNVSGSVTVCDTKPVTSLVPTEVKINDQDFKIDELTKLVQMLMDEKINSTQRIQESKSVNPHSESSKSVNSSKMSQESKPDGKNTDLSKPFRPKPLQKPKLKCELCH